MARFAVLIVLNSPAPMSAEQLRVNLHSVIGSCCTAARSGYAARCAHEAIFRINNATLGDEQGSPRVTQRLQFLSSSSLGDLRRVDACTSDDK
jgi:hypothetical protein